jgi:serine/threonine protein kinase
MHTVGLVQEIDFFSIAADVACGMEFLHTRMQLMHRDLKSPNILMDLAGKAKLADFGLTCLEQPDGEKTAEIGTYRWMAPEVRVCFSVPLPHTLAGVIRHNGRWWCGRLSFDRRQGSRVCGGRVVARDG